MQENNIKTTGIEGLLIIENPTYPDERGSFREVLKLRDLEEHLSKLDTEFSFKQWNHSVSKPGVIRGIHAENWNKIVYPVSGKMYVAIVDLRPESHTFGKVEEIYFEEPNNKALFIKRGLGNSICNIGDKDINYLYLVDAYYDGTDTTAIAWDDPDLGIKWPVEIPIISERDKNNPTMRQKFPNKYK